MPPHTSLVGGRRLFPFCPFDSNFVYKDLGRKQLVSEDSRTGCAHVLPLSKHRDALQSQGSPLRSRRHRLLLVGKVLTRGSKGCG